MARLIEDKIFSNKNSRLERLWDLSTSRSSSHFETHIGIARGDAVGQVMDPDFDGWSPLLVFFSLPRHCTFLETYKRQTLST